MCGALLPAGFKPWHCVKEIRPLNMAWVFSSSIKGMRSIVNYLMRQLWELLNDSVQRATDQLKANQNLFLFKTSQRFNMKVWLAQRSVLDTSPRQWKQWLRSGTLVQSCTTSRKVRTMRYVHSVNPHSSLHCSISATIMQPVCAAVDRGATCYPGLLLRFHSAARTYL